MSHTQADRIAFNDNLVNKDLELIAKKMIAEWLLATYEIGTLNRKGKKIYYYITRDGKNTRVEVQPFAEVPQEHKWTGE